MPEIVIIGAGIAGLYLASRLGKRAVVLERLGVTGGRIRTVRDESRVRHEAGAWRVKDHHSRVIALAEELGIALPYMDAGTDILTGGEHPSGDQWRSTRDFLIAEEGLEGYQDRENKIGYHGFGGKAKTTASYGVGGKQSRHRYVKGGFDQFTERLKKLALDRGAQIFVGHEAKYIDIVDIDDLSGKVRVLGIKRSPAKVVEEFSFEADNVICCVPPHKLPVVLAEGRPRIPGVFRGLQASLASVPLVHVYARSPTQVPPFKVVTHLPVSQCIAPAASGLDWQPCYASGDDAWFWYRMWLNDRPAFFKELKHQLQLVQDAHSDLSVQLLDHLGSEADVRLHFWENAVHMWLPAPGFQKMGAIRLGTCPKPNQHPQIMVAGEAASGCQGWAEGAIRTSDMVLRRLQDRPPLPPLIRSPDDVLLCFDGLEVSIPRTWIEVHPGTSNAIMKYAGKEISGLFDIVHSSNHPYRYIFSFLSSRFHS